MCTVTYLPVGNSVFLTSNRDVQQKRTPATPPEAGDYLSGKIMFPRDGEAGGTWIAAHQNGNVVIFLNGAFKAHTPEPPYRKSRGLILLDLIDHTTPFNSFLAINLNNIEPFTAIIRDNIYLFECRWDGERKHYTELDADRPHIWSSVTLYDPEIAQRRTNWFADWFSRHRDPYLNDIMHFHQHTGEGDPHNDLVIDRDGKVATVSITSIHIDDVVTSMHYLDVKSGSRYKCSLETEPTMAANG